MKKLIVGIALFSITGFSYFLPQQPCQELWQNCTATAIENYHNGSYSFEVFYMFYNDICPGAYGDCMGM